MLRENEFMGALFWPILVLLAAAVYHHRLKAPGRDERIEAQITQAIGVHPRNVFRVDRVHPQVLRLTCLEGGKVSFKDYVDSREFREDVINTLPLANPEVTVRI